MASRNGLSPRIRRPKGVGFGRALPGAFAFANGVVMDGGNDFFTIPMLIGKTLPPEITIEFFTKQGIAPNWLVPINTTLASGNPLVSAFNYSSVNLQIIFPSTSTNAIGPFGTLNQIVHVISQIQNNVHVYLNGGASKGGATKDYGAPSLNNYDYSTTGLLTGVIIGQYVGVFQSAPMDELRIYSSAMREDQVVLNWNNGIGNNPCETEHLLGWYQFEKFETLDFSALQDGSDMRLGIRDISGHNNHLLPHNMVTTPGTGYVLQPF